MLTPSEDYLVQRLNALGGPGKVLQTSPSQVLGYTQSIALQSGIVGDAATITDLTGLSLTVTVLAGRLLKISGHVSVQHLSANGYVDIYIREGTVVVGDAARTTAAGEFDTIDPVCIVAPSAGTHTYKLSAIAQNGTVTVLGTVPSGTIAASDGNYLLVEDIGMAP